MLEVILPDERSGIQATLLTLTSSSSPIFQKNSLGEDISAPEEGAPNVRRVTSQGGLHNIHVFKILGFKDFGDHVVRIFYHPPHLFSQEGFIENTKVSECHTSFALR